jgi:hypothetical protein
MEVVPRKKRFHLKRIGHGIHIGTLPLPPNLLEEPQENKAPNVGIILLINLRTVGLSY